MKPLYIISFILCALLFVTLGFAEENELNIAHAEKAAQTHMKSFFAIDMNRVVALTHPETIEMFSEVFLLELERAKKDGVEEQFKSEMGIKKDLDEIAKLDPTDMYITVIGANNRRGPKEYRDQMKKVNIEVIGSRRVDESTAHVMMRYSFPGPNNESVLELKLHKGQWKVTGNAPNL